MLERYSCFETTLNTYTVSKQKFLKLVHKSNTILEHELASKINNKEILINSHI